MNDIIYKLLASEEIITIDQVEEMLRQQGKTEGEISLVRKAYNRADEIHKGQTRESKDAYITHPVHVAWNLLIMGIYDIDTICAGLLHDTVEDSKRNFTVEDIANEFNDTIAILVDGVTKIRDKSVDPEQIKQVNFQRILEGLTKDSRIIFIKLADRLHNMATLYHKVKPHKKIAIAEETLLLYVPLAKVVGAHQVSNVLEDLSMKYLYEAEFELLSGLKEEKLLADKEKQLKIKAQIEEELKEHNINYKDVIIRDQSLYTLFNKLYPNSITKENLDMLIDAFYYKIVVDDNTDPYSVISVLHEHQYKFGSFKDYISDHKGNFYYSISTTVRLDDGYTKFKVRKNWQNELACFGLPYYWNNGISFEETQKMLEQEPFCIAVKSALNMCQTPAEFYEILLKLLGKKPSYVYVDGYPITLPPECTIARFVSLYGPTFGHEGDIVKVNGIPYSINSQAIIPANADFDFYNYMDKGGSYQKTITNRINTANS